MAIRVRGVRVNDAQQCPLCREALGDALPHELGVCRVCGAASHSECVAELGGGRCATAGCGARISPERVLRPTHSREVKGGRVYAVSVSSGLLDSVLLVALAFAIFVGLMIGVGVVLTYRLHYTALLVPSLAPLVLWGGWQLIKAWRASARERGAWARWEDGRA